ncbi:MAG: lactate utilization protein B/C [Cytophagales bacterium]|nr:MAG: lactate utilization protein B/C [Cytophagales bacterium]
MNQREQILSAVKKNKPQSTPLPEMKLFDGQCDSILDKYVESLNKIGGTCKIIDRTEDINMIVKSQFSDLGQVATNMQEVLIANIDLKEITDPHQLEQVNIAVLHGELAVAENGAVWLEGKQIIHQAIPFITQHLILVIERENIVENMHVAYSKINIERPSYGVFIAGPSKTADIEQSLVIGAHGSRSLLVLIR